MDIYRLISLHVWIGLVVLDIWWEFVPIAPLEKQIGDVFSFYFICCMFLIIFHLLLLAVIPFSCCLSMPLTHNYLYIIVSIFSFFLSVLLSDVIPLPALFFLLASVVSPEMIEGKTSQKKLACFKSRINIKLWFIWLQQKISFYLKYTWRKVDLSSTIQKD